MAEADRLRTRNGPAAGRGGAGPGLATEARGPPRARGIGLADGGAWCRLLRREGWCGACPLQEPGRESEGRERTRGWARNPWGGSGSRGGREESASTEPLRGPLVARDSVLLPLNRGERVPVPERPIREHGCGGGTPSHSSVGRAGKSSRAVLHCGHIYLLLSDYSIVFFLQAGITCMT